MVILTLGKSQKWHGARSGEKGGLGHTTIFLTEIAVPEAVCDTDRCHDGG